jgi:hypothetical protein
MHSKDRTASSQTGKVFPILGLALAVAGLLLTLSALTSSVGRSYADPSPTATATPGTATINLHNNTADTGTDCPDTTNDYWHFVLAPNDGTFKFAVLHLNIGGTVFNFNVPADVALNGGQYDNLFVKVPDGKSLTDLQLSGSSAEYTGVGTPQFNLSHVCDGTGTPTPTSTPTSTATSTPTSTATSTPTNTTVPPTATPTNTPQTLIIVTPTNTPVPLIPLVPTATPTLVAQVSGVVSQPTPVSQVAGVSVLPSAGDGGQRADRAPLLALGLGLMAAGAVVFAVSRRLKRSAGAS